MKRHLFYLCCFVSILLFGSIKAGPLTINNYATLLLAFSILSNYKKNVAYFKNKELVLFILFAVYFYFTLLLNGELFYFDSITYFFGRVIPSIIVFIALNQYIRTQTEVKYLAICLIIISIFGYLVSLGQFALQPFAFNLADKINASNEVDLADFSNVRDGVLGRLHVYGIWGKTVKNGFMISSLFVLPFIFWGKNKFKDLFLILIILLSIITMFIVQQRTAFVLMMISLLLVFKVLNPKLLISLFVVILIIGIFFTDSFQNTFEEIESGRLFNFQDDLRGQMTSVSINWISNNFLLGGPYDFGNDLISKVGLRDPHNFFLSAFVYGGFIGAFLIILLFLRMTFFSIKNIYREVSLTKKTLSYTYIFSIITLVSLLNGLTHNNSLVFAYSENWIFYALLLRSYQLKL